MAIRLEPFSESDFDRLISWVPSESFLLQWAGPGFSFPLDHKQLSEHLVRGKQEPPGSLIFRGVDASTGAVIGHIEIVNIDRRNRSARLSRVLVGPMALRGNGIGHELVREALAVAFDELQLHRVELYVFDFNEAAIGCYKRAGFKLEGVLRDARRYGNEYWTLLAMSILQQERRA
jgi:RimJ/RimL family protein N-acetyltransferase